MGDVIVAMLFETEIIYQVKVTVVSLRSYPIPYGEVCVRVGVGLKYSNVLLLRIIEIEQFQLAFIFICSTCFS